MEIKITYMDIHSFENKYPNWYIKENGNYKNLPNEYFIVNNSVFDYLVISNRKGRVFCKYVDSLNKCFNLITLFKH